ncbi:MAG: hypothetical protein IT427_04850 [Pirellulales bacterium]|nr:hypothetical protein [Pirellulales bacterium]
MSLVTDPELGAPVNEFAEFLGDERDSIEQLLNGVFDDMESMCKSLDEQQSIFDRRCQTIESEKQQLSRALEQQHSIEPCADSALQAKIGELEQERQALEDELEAVRNRAADLATTISEQKRQMADERAEWTSELRQMRRVLDKQSTWIAQQAQQANAISTPPSGYLPPGPGTGALASPNGNYAPAQAVANHDPVLGSVLTQFELLRKDLERRRAPPKVGGHKNVNAS